METKLYKVNVTLTKDGFKETITEWDILKEGDKTFNINKMDKDGLTVTKFKKKVIIGTIDSGVFYNSNERIHYGGWCFEHDIERIKADAKSKIIKTAESFFNAISQLMIHVCQTA